MSDSRKREIAHLIKQKAEDLNKLMKEAGYDGLHVEADVRSARLTAGPAVPVIEISIYDRL